MKKRKNKGFTLIEIVCAVAIFTIAVGAVSGALILSGRSFSSGSMNVELQQEAQTTSNLISNLVIDSTSVVKKDLTPDGKSSGSITIQDAAENTMVIEYVRDEENPEKSVLTYTRQIKGSAELETGILAEGVSSFYADDSHYADSKNVYFDLGLTSVNGTNDFKTSFAVTSRNEGTEFVEWKAESNVALEVNPRVIIEPGQTLTLPCKINGSELGFTVGGLTNNKSSSTRVAVSADGKGIDITAGSDETAREFYFTVAARNAGGGRADEALVKVKVRRVYEIKMPSEYTFEGKKGDSYTIVATFTDFSNESNLKDAGYYSDDDYIDPLSVQFEIVESKSNIEVGFWGASGPHYFNWLFYRMDRDKHGVTVTYTMECANDVPEDTYFTIRAKAMHSYGRNGSDKMNKSGVSYDKPVYADTLIKFKKQSEPIIEFEDPDSGINRGNDTHFTTDIAAVENVINSLKTANNQVDVNNSRWFMRVRNARADGKYYDEDWSPYVVTNESSRNAQKLNANESYLFYPEANVQLEMVLVNYMTDDAGKKVICWPNYPSLLANGSGFKERGYQFAWEADSTRYIDPGVASISDCGNLFDIPTIDIQKNIGDGSQFNYVYDTATKTYSQSTIPTFTNDGTEHRLKLAQPIKGFDQNIGMNSMQVVLQKKNAAGVWETVGDLQYSQYDVVIDQNFVNNKGTGEYRFGIAVKESVKFSVINDVTSVTGVSIENAKVGVSGVSTSHTLTTDERCLFDEETGEGFIYFNTQKK